jgi:PhnB protein
MGADVPPGVEFSPAGNISISLSGDDADELRDFWDTLSDGGISWMVNIAQD